MAIVKVKYRAQANVGQIGRSVAYYTCREDPDRRPGGQPTGGRWACEPFWREVTDCAHEAPYTYRILLSTRDIVVVGPPGVGRAAGGAKGRGVRPRPT